MVANEWFHPCSMVERLLNRESGHRVGPSTHVGAAKTLSSKKNKHIVPVRDSTTRMAREGGRGRLVTSLLSKIDNNCNRYVLQSCHIVSFPTVEHSERERLRRAPLDTKQSVLHLRNDNVVSC